jgi:iron-sulfur cluster assembly protein
MPIELTENAIRKIRVTMEKEQMAGLRLGVRGGGCSGMSYVLRFEREPKPKDQVFDFSGAKVFVDPKSFPFLDGMQVDFHETLLEQGFRFQNPNAEKTCSCGTSFSA